MKGVLSWLMGVSFRPSVVALTLQLLTSQVVEFA